MEYRPTFAGAAYDVGRSQQADMNTDLSVAAAAAMDQLPVDQREVFQTAVGAYKTFEELPPELADFIKPFMDAVTSDQLG